MGSSGLVPTSHSPLGNTQGASKKGEARQPLKVWGKPSLLHQKTVLVANLPGSCLCSQELTLGMELEFSIGDSKDRKLLNVLSHAKPSEDHRWKDRDPQAWQQQGQSYKNNFSRYFCLGLDQNENGAVKTKGLIRPQAAVG